MARCERALLFCGAGRRALRARTLVAHATEPRSVVSAFRAVFGKGALELNWDNRACTQASLRDAFPVGSLEESATVVTAFSPVIRTLPSARYKALPDHTNTMSGVAVNTTRTDKGSPSFQ